MVGALRPMLKIVEQVQLLGGLERGDGPVTFEDCPEEPEVVAYGAFGVDVCQSRRRRRDCQRQGSCPNSCQ